MFGAAAVRQKKRLKEQQIAAGGGVVSRGPRGPVGSARKQSFEQGANE